MSKQLNFRFLVLLFIIMAPSVGFGKSYTISDSSLVYKLLPDYGKLQYAGGIGFISGGFAYSIIEHRLDASLMYGYVPKFATKEPLHSITVQLSTKILRIKEYWNTELISLSFGVFACHTIGKDYWIREPSKYPKDYYWWTPGQSWGFNLTGEIKTTIWADKHVGSGLGFYFSAGTRDLYIVSKYDNKSIPYRDIIELGFGINVYK